MTRPVDILFPNMAAAKAAGFCPICNTLVDPAEFRHEDDVREFQISGMCMECQDEVFFAQ